MKTSEINLALISASLYSSFQVIANVLSTKITLVPFISSLSMDGGTVIYPLTFTLRDFVHKTCGKKNARLVVIFSALLSLAAAFLFWMVGKMPADPTWTLQGSYESILTPVFRITVASVLAQLISELIDTEVFSFIYHKFNDVLGSLLSNFVSLVADSFIFSLIAFVGVLPLDTVIKIIVSNIIVKLVVSLLSSPFIRLIPRTAEIEEI